MINKLLIATLLITTAAFAQQGRGFEEEGPGLGDQLKLTPPQVEQIQKLRTKFLTECIDLRADLQKLRLELRGQMQADKPNKRTIDATIDKSAAKKAALEKLQVGHRLEVRALLTDEQKKVFGSRPFGRGRGMGMGYRAPRQGLRSRGGRW